MPIEVKPGVKEIPVFANVVRHRTEEEAIEEFTKLNTVNEHGNTTEVGWRYITKNEKYVMVNESKGDGWWWPGDLAHQKGSVTGASSEVI
jgi:hypothetical protein